MSRKTILKQNSMPLFATQNTSLCHRVCPKIKPEKKLSSQVKTLFVIQTKLCAHQHLSRGHQLLTITVMGLTHCVVPKPISHRP